MKENASILRLIYPQWQGGIIAHWIPDIPADDAFRSYYLGSQLLNYLASKGNYKYASLITFIEVEKIFYNTIF